MPTLRLAPAVCATAMLATFVASVAAQGSVDLGKRNGRSKYTLGRVFAAQELPDGRVVASDTKEQVFRMVDFAKGEVGLVGQQGDDSASFRAASTILRLGGDSLGLYDPIGRKMAHLTPQGTVAQFVALPKSSNGRSIGTLIGADPNGSLYFTLPERFDTVTKGLVGYTSVTRIGIGADADEPQLTFRTRGADQLKPTGIMPYIYKDAVAVRSDGLLARVVADSYQVVWFRNGRETGRTGPIAYTPIPITVTEQQQIKDSTVEAMKAMMSAGRGGGAPDGGTSFGRGGGGAGPERTIVMMGAGGGGGGMAMPAGAMALGGGGGRVIINGTDVTGAAGSTTTVSPGNFNFADMPLGTFPENKPPILSSGVVATFDHNGMLWVARERVHGDQVPHYDVIAEGKGVVSHVNLPAGTRLVGFGKNSVYLARTDEGSDWLERYAMPKM